MKAYEFFSQELFGSLDQHEGLKILFLLVEGRIWLNGSLMIAVRMCAFELVGKTDSFHALNARSGQNISRQGLKEESLQLDKNSLDSVSRGPSLVDLLLFRI